MKWKLMLEIIGMATALAALFGVFGILLNIFFKGEYFMPIAGITIVEPQIMVLIVEIFLIVVSIPVMIYVGLKDIKSLVKIEKNNEAREKLLEKKASNVFVRAMLIGLTLTFIVGLIIYVDDMNYRNEKLNLQVKNLNKEIVQINGTLQYMEMELDMQSEKIKNLTVENKILSEAQGE